MLGRISLDGRGSLFARCMQLDRLVLVAHSLAGGQVSTGVQGRDNVLCVFGAVVNIDVDAGREKRWNLK